MANTLTLRRRIKSAQNISKTTKAMQMISASRLKKAQEATLASRPYVERLTLLTQNLSPKKIDEDADTFHPYMETKHTSGKSLYIFIAPDKGLCGGLIMNVVREFLKLKNEKDYYITVGKKIETPIGAGNKNLLASFHFGINLPSFDMIYPIAQIVDEYFLGGKVDNVYLVTTHFKSVFSQETTVTKLLPVSLPEEKAKTVTGTDFRLYEPTSKELLPTLLKRYLEMELFQSLLESFASEQASRMIAMQNATNNAKDLVNQFRLLYNKARQEKITNEILDISSAAVAMENEE